MELSILYELSKDEKMHKFLKENSIWYKYLNRDPSNYMHFKDAMKKKYRLRVTDRISDTIDNIDLINSLLKVMK